MDAATTPRTNDPCGHPLGCPPAAVCLLIFGAVLVLGVLWPLPHPSRSALSLHPSRVPRTLRPPRPTPPSLLSGLAVSNTLQPSSDAYAAQGQAIALSSHAGSDGATGPEGLLGLEKIRAALPFITDPELVVHDVQYSGPLQTLTGREEYVEAMCQWQQNLPQRLSAFNITDVQLFQLRPGACRAKWYVPVGALCSVFLSCLK